MNFGVVRINHNNVHLQAKDWDINDVEIYGFIDVEAAYFWLKDIKEVIIDNLKLGCSRFTDNCMLIYAQGFYTQLTIKNSHFFQEGDGYYYEHYNRSPIHADIHQLFMEDNTFQDFNKVGYMGGVLNLEIEDACSEKRGIYTNNQESDYGAVFFFRGISKCTFEESLFKGNQAKYGGALFTIDHSAIVL